MNQKNKTESKRSKRTREVKNETGDTRKRRKAVTDDVPAPSQKRRSARLGKKRIDAGMATTGGLAGSADNAGDIRDVGLHQSEHLGAATPQTTQPVPDAAPKTIAEIKEHTRRAVHLAWQVVGDKRVLVTFIGLGSCWLLASRRRTSALRPSFRRTFDNDSNRSLNAPAKHFSGPHTQRQRDLAAYNLLRALGARFGGDGSELARPAGESWGRVERELSERAWERREGVQNALKHARHAFVAVAEAKPLTAFFGTLIAGVGVGFWLQRGRRA